MRSRRTRVCKWCLQPLPDWSDVWPVHPGIYLFYGYPINKDVDGYPRLILVTVEHGPRYRTQRSTLKKTTGAAGFFMPLLSPESYPETKRLEEIAETSLAESRKFKVKKLKTRLSEEFG
jgi:hypothetical protein